MFLKRKAIFSIVLLLVICAVSYISQPLSQSKPTSAYAENHPQIILDAGHAALENTID